MYSITSQASNRGAQMNFETTQHNPSAVAQEDIPSKWYMINGEMFETKYVCYLLDEIVT